MTIHWLKLELKRLRYLENCARHVSSLPKAITFDPAIGISFSLVLWKLDIQTFLGTSRSGQLEFEKTFKYATKFEPGKSQLLMLVSTPAHPLGSPIVERSNFQDKYRLTPQDQKKKGIWAILGAILCRLSLSLSLSKNTQKPLILCFFPTIKCSCSHLPLLGFRTLDLRFKGVDVAFQLLSTPIQFSQYLTCFIAFPNIYLA